MLWLTGCQISLQLRVQLGHTERWARAALAQAAHAARYYAREIP